MANSSPADFTALIQQILDDRQRHADALGAVEQTLAQIGALLGGTSNGSPDARPRSSRRPLPTSPLASVDARPSR
jgi:hypothetical protein